MPAPLSSIQLGRAHPLPMRSGLRQQLRQSDMMFGGLDCKWRAWASFRSDRWSIGLNTLIGKLCITELMPGIRSMFPAFTGPDITVRWERHPPSSKAQVLIPPYYHLAPPFRRNCPRPFLVAFRQFSHLILRDSSKPFSL